MAEMPFSEVRRLARSRWVYFTRRMDDRLLCSNLAGELFYVSLGRTVAHGPYLEVIDDGELVRVLDVGTTYPSARLPRHGHADSLLD